MTNDTPPLGSDISMTSQFTAIGSGSDPLIADRRTLLPEEVAAIESLPYGSALLIALAGPNVGARFLLNSDTANVGRHPRADIFLDDFTVSRRHAQFLREGNTFRVCDSGSLNGTYVNRERIDVAELHEADEIQIGKYRLTIYPSRNKK